MTDLDKITQEWRARHERALAYPRGVERPIVDMFNGWAEYGREYRGRYGSCIGNDGVLGPAWAAIGQSLIALLNGELGRLDGGELDRTIRHVGTREACDNAGEW